MAVTIQYYGTGRRKSAAARVFLRPGSGTIQVNARPLAEAFPIETLRTVVRTPLLLTEVADKFDIVATAAGGGIAGQAGALRLGVLIGLGDEVVRMLSSVCLGRRLGHALGSPRFQCNK